MKPSRGEVWLADFDHVMGREQKGKRPCLILSSDEYPSDLMELIVILPITTKIRELQMRFSVLPPEGGLVFESQIMCDQIRSVSTKRLIKRLGTVSQVTLDKAEEILRWILEL